ncbi:MAG: VWA domain-containing protein [Acidobacteria bacterium]|nr:VWA domain-containing protein [Acidobacteriota bacterium]
MTLLAPWFLAGLVALGLPLWLHLLERQNPVRVPFSSLMFFERRTERSIRQRRLRYLLLLAARLALLALLALAFARPAFYRPVTGSSGGFRNRLVAIDTSFSMRYGERWRQAKAEALALVDGLRSGDRAQVIGFGPGVRVMNAPSSDRAALRSAIEGLEPTWSRNSYGELGQSLRALTQGAGPESAPLANVHVISDFQQSAMPGRFADLSLPTNASLEVHNVATGVGRNWCVESVKGDFHLYEKARPRIEVTVAGFDTPATTRRVTLAINGRQVASKNADVPESGRTTVEFADFEVPHGHSRGEVRIDSADPLPGDDVRLLSFERADPLPILFLHQSGRAREMLYYRTALESSAQSMFMLQAATPADAGSLALERFAFVVISDVPRLPALFEKRLKAFIEAGGAALLVIGPSITLEGAAPVLGLRVADAQYTGREKERFQQVAEMDSSHPALRGAKRFEGVKFFRYARWDTPAEKVLARLSDGSPLLIEEALGAGRLLALASPLDNIWNDLPIHPLFVPFVAESARYLSGVEETTTQATVDSILELHKRRDPRATVEVIDPSGHRALTLAEAVSSREMTLTSTGFYEIRRAGQTELVAANPDPRESDLRPIDEDVLALWKATGRTEPTSPNPASPAGSKGAPQSAPEDIWRAVMLVALAAAVIESLLGNLHLGLRREAQSE